MSMSGASAGGEPPRDAVLWSGMRARILLNGGALQRRSESSASRGAHSAAAARRRLRCCSGASRRWRSAEETAVARYREPHPVRLLHRGRRGAARPAAGAGARRLARQAAWLLRGVCSPGAWRCSAHCIRRTGASAAQLAQRCVQRRSTARSRSQADFAEALALRSACLGAAAGQRRAARAVRRSPRAQGHRTGAAAGRRAIRAYCCSMPWPTTSCQRRSRATTRAAAPKLRGDGGRLRGRAPRRGAVARAGARRRRACCSGASLLDHGDPVGARDALEHALLIAPQYAQARRLMAKITAG